MARSGVSSLVHRMLKIPELEVDLKTISHGDVNAVVAERYRSRGNGRVSRWSCSTSDSAMGCAGTEHGPRTCKI